MATTEEDTSLLKALLEAGRFRAGDSFARVPAATCLTGFCGVPPSRLSELTRAALDLTEGKATLDLADTYGTTRWRRIIPVVETARIVLQRYLESAPDKAPQAPLLQTLKGGPVRYQNVERQFLRALSRCGRTGLSLGGLRARYIRLVQSQRTNETALAIEFLCGYVHEGTSPADSLLNSQIQDHDLRRILYRALPLAQPWRLLTHVIRRQDETRGMYAGDRRRSKR